MAPRRALTLIELLVVMSIVALVTASTIPVLAPVVSGRKIREASRVFNVYCSAARAEAAATGRPVGVMIAPRDFQSAFAMTVVTAQVPPPYCGDTTASRLAVFSNGFARLTTGDTGWVGLLRLGDMVKVDYQGGTYRISAADTDQNGFLLPSCPGWFMARETATEKNAPEGLPFQVLRQPTPTAAPPLQLPDGIVIDLNASGFAGNEFAPVDATPVTIMFAPDGSLSRVYYSGNSLRPTQPVYLLLGRRAGVTASASDPKTNWRDPTTLWICINPQTGHITSAENAATDAGIVDPAHGLPLARKIAASGQSMGGR